MVNSAFYNESLVRRGEIILDFGIIDGWYDELERMNEGKRGAAYGYLDSFVQLVGYVKASILNAINVLALTLGCQHVTIIFANLTYIIASCNLLLLHRQIFLN